MAVKECYTAVPFCEIPEFKQRQYWQEDKEDYHAFHDCTPRVNHQRVICNEWQQHINTLGSAHNELG